LNFATYIAYRITYGWYIYWGFCHLYRVSYHIWVIYLLRIKSYEISQELSRSMENIALNHLLILNITWYVFYMYAYACW
jgi:hypothetical protein